MRGTWGWTLAGCAAAILCWLSPTSASAREDGIVRTELTAAGCGAAACHEGGASGTNASIAFSSPIVVGQPVTVTVTVTPASAAAHPRAGFNLQMGSGSFNDPPGPGSQRSGTSVREATHVAPSASRTWTLTWTPSATGLVSYTLYGNAVNFDGTQNGDAPIASPVVASVNVGIATGSACSSDGQCGSGECVEGFCCENACADACFTCAESGNEGSCEPRPVGTLCCASGESWNGSTCVVDDPCSAGTDDCVAIATCTDVPGTDPTYTCTCPHEGYTGNGRSTGGGCRDVNECTGSPCGMFGSTGGEDGNGCSQIGLGSWMAPGYTCECQAGFEFDGTTCVRQNECTSGMNDCHPAAICADPDADTTGDFTCTCPAGWTGMGHGAMGCVDVDECAMSTDDCASDATCTNVDGGFTCACNDGFIGDGRTCVDVDECLDPRITAMCDTQSRCVNTPGSFECQCNDGFEGDGLVGCTDIDECDTGTDRCDPFAICFNTFGDHTCTCRDGLLGDGETCTDVDECLDPEVVSRCSTAATCINSPGAWECVCDEGYRGDGNVCDDIDECREGMDLCDRDATCTNTVGSYTCMCNDGFGGSGFECTDVDECAEGTGGCGVNERCVNRDGDPNICVCVDGTARNLEGNCEFICGDGTVSPGEECDDENTANGDGCSSRCDVEPGYVCFEPTGGASECNMTCGDGFVDEGEECDDGDANSDTEPDACRERCVEASCGDGVTDTGEECDEADANSDTEMDACRTTCVSSYCGDMVIDSDESCDPGGFEPGAAPAGTCTSECGDGTGDGGPGPTDPPMEEGCSCRAVSTGDTPRGVLLFGALFGLALLRRRRR